MFRKKLHNVKSDIYFNIEENELIGMLSVAPTTSGTGQVEIIEAERDLSEQVCTAFANQYTANNLIGPFCTCAKRFLCKPTGTGINCDIYVFVK